MSGPKYDFLVVGAGLFGSVFAREAADRGRRVLVVDERPHIGGNCRTEEREGIHVHLHGPHCFHTANRRVWEYVTRFAEFNGYSHRVKARHGDTLYSFPINLMTLHQLWGVRTPAEAARKLAEVRVSVDYPRNLEEWCLSQVGREVYETFIRGYTAKQWGRDPAELPSSLIRRLPLRLTLDDRYYHSHDRYEGVPVGGYTALFERMLDGIEVRTGVDFLAERPMLEGLAAQVVYTGAIDRLFGYRHGRLEYRSLLFHHEVQDGDHQGCAQVNYTDAEVPYTRVVEHKHFANPAAARTVVTWEYPQAHTGENVPYYPVGDARNAALYERYAQDAREIDLILGGRLASYKYLDMDMTMGQALVTADRVLG